MEPRSIEDIIRIYGASRPDKPIASFDGETTSYGEMHRRSSQIANQLSADGIGHADRIALVAKNGPDYFALLFGARKVGAVVVTVNWRLSPDEMAYIIHDAAVKMLFVEDEFLAGVRSVADQIPHVRKTVRVGMGQADILDMDDWLSDAPGSDTAYQSGPDDIALQLYTSGTTGRPKGVLLNNACLFSFLNTAARLFGASGDEVHLNALPLFHVGGMNWSLQCMAHGAHCIGFRDFDAEQVVTEIERSQVTHLMTVPAVLKLLLETDIVKTANVGALQSVTYGGSSIDLNLLKQAIDVFGNVFHGMYGSTELSFGLTHLSPAEHVDPARPDILSSSGRAVDGTTLRVVDPITLDEMPEAQIGEIWVMSPQRAAGYWNRAEETAETFREDGWYRTGDMGHVDDGYVYITDRLNDMIISGGENIYPAEIERVLMEYDGVYEVVAFGIPDKKWREAVHVVVIARPDAALDAAAMIEFCKERLASYKCPRSISFADALERNPSGKVLRAKMRAPYWRKE